MLGVQKDVWKRKVDMTKKIFIIKGTILEFDKETDYGCIFKKGYMIELH